MNRADRMYDALADGLPRTRHEIFSRAGCFFLTNNAASELRARGVEIVQWQHEGEFVYQVVRPLESAAAGGSEAAPAAAGSSGLGGGGTGAKPVAVESTPSRTPAVSTGSPQLSLLGEAAA